MKRIVCLFLCSVLLWCGCASAESGSGSVASHPESIPETIRVADVAEEIPPGLFDGIKADPSLYEIEVVHFAPAAERAVITGYYYSEERRLLLMDNGVALNLNGYNLVDARVELNEYTQPNTTLSEDGQRLIFSVPEPGNKAGTNLYQVDAAGQLLCLAAGCQRIYFGESSSAVAFVQDGNLYFYPPSADTPKEITPFVFSEEGRVDDLWGQAHVVFSPDGEWIQYESKNKMYVASYETSPRLVGGLGTEYLLEGIGNDGNLVFYSESTVSDGGRDTTLYCLNLQQPGSSITLPHVTGCTLLFNADSSEILLISDEEAFLYTTQKGWYTVHPANVPEEIKETREYCVYVNGWMVHCGHSCGPLPAVTRQYTDVGHFTRYEVTTIHSLLATNENGQHLHPLYVQMIREAQGKLLCDYLAYDAYDTYDSLASSKDGALLFYMSNARGEEGIYMAKEENGVLTATKVADSDMVIGYSDTAKTLFYTVQEGENEDMVFMGYQIDTGEQDELFVLYLDSPLNASTFYGFCFSADGTGLQIEQWSSWQGGNDKDTQKINMYYYQIGMDGPVLLEGSKSSDDLYEPDRYGDRYCTYAIQRSGQRFFYTTKSPAGAYFYTEDGCELLWSWPR